MYVYIFRRRRRRRLYSFDVDKYYRYEPAFVVVSIGGGGGKFVFSRAARFEYATAIRIDYDHVFDITAGALTPVNRKKTPRDEQTIRSVPITLSRRRPFTRAPNTIVLHMLTITLFRYNVIGTQVVKMKKKHTHTHTCARARTHTHTYKGHGG